MADSSYDVIVLGSGPAGEGAAMSAVKDGKRVCVIDRPKMIGGNCTHKGTIPSKALRHQVKQMIRYNSTPLYRSGGEPLWASYPEILEEATRVIPRQSNMHARFFSRNRIPVIYGEASFDGPGVVKVLLSDGVYENFRAEHIIIATGSRPYQPHGIDFSHPRVYDSDSILTMAHTPRHITIYGAGVIGCEYASIFAGLGVKVDLINGRDRLLSFLDDEISDALSYHLRNMGVTVRHSEDWASVESDDQKVTLTTRSGKRLQSHALLWSNGRSGNTENLNLESIGLEADHRGQLKVNERYETEVDGVYAVGDVIGWPSLASSSYDQGRACARGICGHNVRFVSDAPTGIYTLPEISSIGKSERELTDQNVPYEVGRAFFKNTARAQISGENVGMLKILFHVDTWEILGIHCFGAEASEIIHIGQAVMSQPGEGNSIKFFVKNTFNYPTMAEAYRTAALEGLNRVRRFG